MYIAKLLSTFLLLIHCYSYSFAYWLPIIPFHSLIHLNCYPFFWPSPPAFSPKTFPISFRFVSIRTIIFCTTLIHIHIINFIESISVGICLVRSFHVFPVHSFRSIYSFAFEHLFLCYNLANYTIFFLLSHFATLRASFSTTFRYILTVVICDGYTFSFSLFSIRFFSLLILPLGYELSFVRLFTGDWNLW